MRNNIYSISSLTKDFLAHGQTMTSGRVKAIRINFKLSQSKFADFIGINVRTLQNWEIDHRKPSGPSIALLYLAETQPDAFIKNRKKLLNQIKQLGLIG